MRLSPGISTPRSRGMVVYVYVGCLGKKKSALALFMPGVLADDAHDVVAADDPAGLAETFDGSSDFHGAKKRRAGRQRFWVWAVSWSDSGSLWMMVP